MHRISTISYEYSYYIVLSLCYILFRATALAILSVKDGLKALKRDKSPTPLQLLVNNMPGEMLPHSDHWPDSLCTSSYIILEFMCMALRV